MLEDLQTVTALPPTVLGVLAFAVLVVFAIGRLSNAGAGRRAESLKRDLLDAKASVPQLESGIRNRDTQIARLEEDIHDLNDRATDLLRTQEQQARELRRSQREVKNLTSELNAVRGKRHSDDTLVMDGFEEEAGESGDSAIVKQLRKTEALYDKLKDALIKRDERIEELELLLQGEQTPPTGAGVTDQADRADAAELQPLRDRIDEQAATIDNLQEQIVELRREKEMLEDLANRRSRSNRALKDATVEIEAKVPALEKTIAERDETIVAREASIKRLLGEVEQARSDIAARDDSIEALTAEIASMSGIIESVEARENELKATIAAREERISALDQELATILAVLNSTREELEEAATRFDEQRAAVDDINTELARRDQAEAALTGTIRDRDFRIDALENEKQALQTELSDARRALASLEQKTEALRHDTEDAERLFEKRMQAVDSEHRISQQETNALKREIEDLKANLTQHQLWMDKLKVTLEERETRARDGEKKLDELRAELDAANESLRRHHDERQMAEDARHELERELVTRKSRTEQMQAELAELEQTLSVYKSMLADKDFRLESLEQELRIATGADGDAEDDAGSQQAVS